MEDSIVQQLRDRAYAFKATDRLSERAADEIERLQSGAVAGRETVRLTDEEREALQWFAHYGLPEHRAAALRKLLERLS